MTEEICMENGFVYYYGNRAGYRKGELVYVDPIFHTRQLKEYLKEQHGLYTKEQEGLYRRLLQCQVYGADGKARLQFCRIWQWKEDVKPEKKFLPYRVYTATFGAVSLEDYQIVYDGYSETGQLEVLYQKFNTSLPEGFPGHPVSMSDVIELYDAQSGSSFFYVDEYGFQPITGRREEER